MLAFGQLLPGTFAECSGLPNRETFLLSDGYPEQAFRAFVDELHRSKQRWASHSSFARISAVHIATVTSVSEYIDIM